MFDEINQKLREERTVRKKMQEEMQIIEKKMQEKEEQWKTELKHVTDSCIVSTVALEERMKRKRPELQSKYYLSI